MTMASHGFLPRVWATFLLWTHYLINFVADEFVIDTNA